MVSSSGDTFAGHSDQLKRLKAQLTHRAPPSRSVSGGSVESSQADLPISPAPQSIPPRRSLPAQRALERVAEVQGSGVLTVESVPSQRRVRKQHVGVGGGTEPELREAKSLIETLRTQVDKHSAALHDSNARSEAAEHVVQRLRGELNVAHAELREADEAAKQAMQAREEHHAKEKSEMLQVFLFRYKNHIFYFTKTGVPEPAGRDAEVRDKQHCSGKRRCGEHAPQACCV